MAMVANKTGIGFGDSLQQRCIELYYAVTRISTSILYKILQVWVLLNIALSSSWAGRVSQSAIIQNPESPIALKRGIELNSTHTYIYIHINMQI